MILTGLPEASDVVSIVYFGKTFYLLALRYINL